MYNINVLILLLFFSNSNVYATNVEELDTIDWTGLIYTETLSNDARWMVTTEQKVSKKRFSTLIDVDNARVHELGQIKLPQFNYSSEYLAYVDSEDVLILLKMSDFSVVKKVQKRVTNYHINWNFSGSTLAFFTDKEKNLHVYDVKQKKEMIYEGTVDYKWHPNEQRLIILKRLSNNEKELELIEVKLDDFKEKVLMKVDHLEVQLLNFSKEGNTYGLLEKVGKEKNVLHVWYNAHYFVLTVNELSTYDVRLFSKNHIEISDSGEDIVLNLPAVAVEKNDVVVWSTSEKWNPYLLTYNRERSLDVKKAIWNLKKNEKRIVSSDQFPVIKWSRGFDKLIKYHPLKYEPMFLPDQYIDLYYEDLKKNKVELIEKKIYNGPGVIHFSNSGRYILYFFDKNWWIYDTEFNLKKNLTIDLSVSFLRDDGIVSNLLPYGFGGWSKNEDELLLYDQYDVWKVNILYRKQTKLTDGINENSVYRRTDNYTVEWNSVNELTFIKKDDLAYTQSICVLESKKIIDVYKTINGISKIIRMGNKFVFIEEAYNLSPIVKKIEKQKITNLYRSNVAIESKDFGFFEYIEIESEIFGRIKGVLLYPSSYNPLKKYPMVLQIYEDKTSYKNEYKPLTDFNSDGFNILKYITNDYFVFLPEIKYTVGQPGYSALHCVELLLDKVVENKSIDLNRIGLIGHSFGGYEAAFIATLSTKFRTIVVGAGVVDLISWYHDYNEEWMKNQDWRMENQQFRMGGGYYDNKEGYRNNSAINKIENIKIPLLIWSGKNDTNINYFQSIYMFNALNKLQKEANLLLFENEAHNLLKPENQKQLTDYIFKWFEKYLK